MRHTILFLLLLLSANIANAQSEKHGSKVKIVDGKSFAQRLQLAVENRNTEAINACFDWSRIFQQANPIALFEGKDREIFLRSLEDGAADDFTERLYDLYEENGSFNILHVLYDGDQAHILARIEASGGCNYHDYSLAHDGDRIVIIDIYNYLTCEPFWKTWERLVTTISLKTLHTNEKAPRDHDIMAEVTLCIGQMTSAIGDNNPWQAIAAYRALPDIAKEDVVISVLRFRAARMTNDNEEYLSAINDLSAKIDNKASLDLLLMDAHLTKGKYEEAMRCINRLDLAIGGDSFLDIMRTNVVIAKGDLQTARRYAKQAIDQIPEILESHQNMLYVQLAIRDHKGTRKTLNHIESVFGIQFGDLRETDPYISFTESAEGIIWLTEHGFR